MKKTVIKVMVAALMIAAKGIVSPMNAQSVCTSSVTILSNNDPTITFSVNPGCGAIGACCTQEFYWNFGDGSSTVTVGTNTVTHTYTASGNYAVYALPSDTCWCSAHGTPNTYTASITNVTITNASFTCSANISITVDSAAAPGNYNYSYSFNPSNATPISYNWSIYGTTTTTATGSSPVFNLPSGSYSVCLSILLSNGTQTCLASSCTALSDTTHNITLYKIGTTDVKSHSSIINVLVYPNPAKDVLFVKVNDATKDKINLQILDLSGRVIKSTSVISDGNINIADIQIGTYILKINTPKGSTNKLWIKE